VRWHGIAAPPRSGKTEASWTLSGVDIDYRTFRNGSAAERRAVATASTRPAGRSAFLVIAGHGVPASLIGETEAVFAAVLRLPLARRLKVKRPAPDVTRGYIPVLAEASVAAAARRRPAISTSPS